MVEITEDKLDYVIDHIGKSVKCMAKAMEALEELKEHSGSEDSYDDEDRYEHERSRHRMGGSRPRGRYDRY